MSQGCKGVTKTGRPCRRAAVEDGYCRQHQHQNAPGDGGEVCAKHLRFIDEYIVDLNGAAAARRAGYAADSAKVTAHRLLTNANLRPLIEQRLNERAMSRAEVLARLTDHGRATLAPFIVLDRERPSGVRIDLSTADADGAFATLKKVKIKSRRISSTIEEETVEVELVDAQAALVHLGKAHGVFSERDASGAVGAPGGGEGADDAAPEPLSPVEERRRALEIARIVVELGGVDPADDAAS